MTTDVRAALRAQLIDHEGMRLRVYKAPAGYQAIGVGRNLDGHGISDLEARILLDNDIARCIGELVSRLDWFDGLDEMRQRAVVDLCFGLGIGRLMTFTVTLSCFARKDYAGAADALIKTLWFRQAGRRAVRVVGMVRTGEDPGL